MTMYRAIYEASTQLNVSKGQLIEIVKDYRVHGDLKTPKQYRRKKDFLHLSAVCLQSILLIFSFLFWFLA